MAIAKNTAKAAEPKAEETKAPAKVKAAPTKKAAPAKAATADVKEAAPKAEKPTVVRIGRKDIAHALREKVQAAGLAISPKVAEVAAASYEEVLTEALAEGKQVSLPGFGVFTSVAKPEAVRPNPQKPGETITIAAHNAPKFKAGSGLKQALNGGADTEDDAGEDGAE